MHATRHVSDTAPSDRTVQQQQCMHAPEPCARVTITPRQVLMSSCLCLRGVSASRVVPKAMAPMPGVTRLTLKRLEVLEIAALLDKFCALQALKLHQVAAMIDRRPPAAASLQHLRSVEMSSCHLHSIPQVRCTPR